MSKLITAIVEESARRLLKMLDTPLLKQLIKNEFIALQNTLFFNSAYMGPFPLRTQKVLNEVIQRSANPSKMDYSWIKMTEQVRNQLSQLFGGRPDNYSLNSSSGEVISFYASGVKLNSGDRIALFNDEYPSDVLPWLFVQQSRGQIEVDFYDKNLLQNLNELKKSLHPKTRFLNISQVGFQTGSRVNILELGKFLKEREIRFLVDSTQALGGINIHPEELAHIDLMVCSPYKWLLAPYGQAFAYWSDRTLNEVKQTQGNWLTQPNAPNDLTVYTTDAKPGARRFDRGQSPNILGLNGLSSSLSLFSELGLAQIEDHNLELVKYFKSNFDSKKYSLVTEGDQSSTIVCLKNHGQDSESLKQQLERSNIDVSVREGNLRISFHFFNNLDQVTKLLAVL